MWPFTELRQQQELIETYRGLIAVQIEHIRFMDQTYSQPLQQRRKIAEGRQMLNTLLDRRAAALESQGFDPSMAVVTALTDDTTLAAALDVADRLEAQGEPDPRLIAAFEALVDLLRPAPDPLADAVRDIFR